MSARRALLVGIERYGEGLDRLPVVHQDIELMRGALQHCGYATEEVAMDGLDADSLGQTLRDFCEDCQDGDIHLIYFSGHGLSVNNKDFIIPPGVTLEDAFADDHSRVPTNLGTFTSSGLVIFVIDACRDSRPLTKGGADEFGYEVAGGSQFVRFFGCSSGETCQVVDKGESGQDISMFTKVLADALREGEHESLRALLDRSTERCAELADGKLRAQKPRLSHGETTAETDKVLDRQIFDPPVRLDVWAAFDPAKLHCLTVTSESEYRKSPTWTLAGMARHTLSGKLGRRVWKTFRAYAHGRRSLRQERRDLAENFAAEAIQLATVNVHEAFDVGVFDEVVRAVIEADLAVFDVSGFEPGMMLLMGIRSACRRGISIATVGGDWRELDEIDIPFNLRDLSLGSHTESTGAIGPDEVTQRFVERIEFGFEQMRKQPTYQDLPAYHALRQLGPEYEAASAIPVDNYVLFLASYGKDYKANWKALRNSIEGYLSDLPRTERSKVQRLVDLGNPQIVSQSLYEQIRRTEGCVADWTEYSPSTFFELGVRLAVSEWGAVQIVDKTYLPDGSNAGDWQSMARQIRRMVELFSPLTYEMGEEANIKDETNIKKAAKELATREPQGSLATEELDDWSAVSRRVSETMNAIAEEHVPVFQRLQDAADALHSPMHGEKGAPQSLFRTSAEQLIQHESERAAMELRIAAWLYLHHRMKAGEREPDDPLRAVYDKLGLDASNALYDAGEVDFADLITGAAEPGPAENDSD